MNRDHAALGALVYDDRFSTYKAQLTWAEAELELRIPAPVDAPTAYFDEVAAALARLDPAAVRTFVAEQLLDLYNDVWSEEEDDIDTAAFLARVRPDLVEYEDGWTTVYFDDGDMFHGHAILVSVDEAGDLIEAKLAG